MSKRQPKPPEELLTADQSRKEAAAEYQRLKEHYPALREHMTPTAIVFAWIQLGDEMWEGVTNART